jgi:hypothetical protein
MVQEVVTKSKIWITAHDPNVMLIPKYLWDDPWEMNGIVMIWIDTLPEKKNGKMTTIDWKDVNVENACQGRFGWWRFVGEGWNDQSRQVSTEN